MGTFKGFYNGLDFLNLILFWGTVVVIILIIIFMILYFSRKKKINIDNEENLSDEFDDIDIIKNYEIIEEKNNVKSNDLKVDAVDDIKLCDDKESDIDFSLKNEGKDNDINSNNENNYEKAKDNNQIEIKEESLIIEKQDEKEKTSLFDDFIPARSEKPRAYEKNVLRAMNSRYQTSPIGIVYEKKENPLEEYKDSMKEPRDEYIKDVYSSLEKAKVPDRIELTDYEKKQEEDAVISYSELLKKRDSINYDSEEDAVISYSELLDRNNKLYNIREEEEDREFLSELKKFRRDL